jgi:sensor histidine kinase YesM
MTSDSIAAVRHNTPSFSRGLAAFMLSSRSDADWGEAIKLTIALWLFVLMIFMPLIMRRHVDGGWSGIALDCSTILFSMALGLILFAIFKGTFDWPTRLRTIMLLSTVMILAIGNATFDIVYTGWVAENFQASWKIIPRDIGRGYEAAFRYLLVFSVNLALFQLASAMRRSLATERQLVDAHASAQQAQLTALRYQLNPHFLFNALNSISALIVTKRNDDAEQMTDKLSTFLRSSLATDPAALVPLAEELSLIEEYLDIEAVRFGDRLDVTIECDDEAGDLLVPGFLVQPLVENAIKYGVARTRNPVAVDICARVEEGSLCITVENDSVPEVTMRAPPRSGVGLINVKQRLAAVYGKAASLTTEAKPDRFCATICIPEIKGRS